MSKAPTQRYARRQTGGASPTPSTKERSAEVEDNAEEERNVPFTQRADHATASSIPGETTPQQTLVRRYHQVRQFTEQLCQPLVTEDYVIQAMPDVSPPKWHLAHTSWFFETFVLAS